MSWLLKSRENKAELDVDRRRVNSGSGTVDQLLQKREKLEEENQTLKSNAKIYKLKWPKTKVV